MSDQCWRSCCTLPGGKGHIIIKYLLLPSLIRGIYIVSCPPLLTRFRERNWRVIVGDHSTIQIQDDSDGTPSSSMISAESFPLLLPSPIDFTVWNPSKSLSLLLLCQGFCDVRPSRYIICMRSPYIAVQIGSEDHTPIYFIIDVSDWLDYYNLFGDTPVSNSKGIVPKTGLRS